MQSVEGAVLVARGFLGSSCGYRRFGGDVMDNKLSELSKPVAWKLHHHGRYYFEESADVVAIAESVGQAKGDAVYSQEYVSALLAELEASKTNASYYKSAFEEQRDYADKFEKRIAELEQEPTIKHMRSVEEALISATDRASEWERKAISNFDECAKMSQRIEELSRLLAHNIERAEAAEAKLATPVRLPNEKAASAMYDIFYQTERYNYWNVQLGFSGAKALGEWIAKALELRGAGLDSEVEK